MTTEQINQGIKLLCDTSKKVQQYYEDDQAIVNALNRVPKEELKQCIDYYKNRKGVIIDLRKELIQNLYNNKTYTVEDLYSLIEKHKQGKENQFQAYTKLFSIFYPPITFYGHNPEREFVSQFIDQLITNLGLTDEVKVTKYDFQGPRQQGSDRFWVAIYNKAQDNQSSSLQIFIEFHKGKVNYGIYKHSEKRYIKPRQQVEANEFSYKDLLNYFATEKQMIINDVPDYSNATKIHLNGSRLYKMSHGSFKAKKYRPIIEAFKGNNWICIYKTTGKGQAEHFKNELKKGDYVYITLGSNELIGIAKIISNEYGYVPEDIVDDDGWLYREIELIKPPVKKNPKALKDTRSHFPSGNTTLAEIKTNDLEEANTIFFKPYFNTEFVMSDNSTIEKDVIKASQNQILYGPPGTGKTYFLKEQLFDKYTLKEESISKEKYFEEVITNLTWWQVITLALIENGKSKVSDILDNRWVATKASLSESKNVRATIWGTLQMHTIEESTSVNYKQRQAPLIFDKTQDKSWELLEVELKEQAPEIYKIKDEVDNFQVNAAKSIKHYDFVTFHQSFSYEDFIEGIKPIFPENDEEASDLGYTIEDGVFKRLCLRAKNDPENRYAIFIDEINRGNVSAIFGELITLIETDKRSGAKNEMSIKLPYSKKEFSVPSNMDIYGTMNTADRSVEALDTALRRRFEFVEKMPDYKVIDQEEVDGVKLSKVLKVINKRIELLIDRDHTIGHSYFVGVDTPEKLTNAFNNKIIPLLQEYFYGDYGKIGLVLGNGFVKEKDNRKLKFSTFKYEGKEDFITPTYKLITVDESTILGAVAQLLETNES
ncbi:McrB family protein [Mangrovimonas spongiae]|uniref:ATPase dynein-related AAA domain-containing protein n=1 Tax=Mangrovimonas spongiae TaxID=2494697 RepID=A0A3R9UTU0_9FLAO|nr:AAA family ATPase [Mangrovimonas spongiae]RSK39973.1 hypothetical protein EJA19_08820 [Mangrovimonas spongiae]